MSKILRITDSYALDFTTSNRIKLQMKPLTMKLFCKTDNYISVKDKVKICIHDDTNEFIPNAQFMHLQKNGASAVAALITMHALLCLHTKYDIPVIIQFVERVIQPLDHIDVNPGMMHFIQSNERAMKYVNRWTDDHLIIYCKSIVEGNNRMDLNGHVNDLLAHFSLISLNDVRFLNEHLEDLYLDHAMHDAIVQIAVPVNMMDSQYMAYSDVVHDKGWGVDDLISEMMSILSILFRVKCIWGVDDTTEGLVKLNYLAANVLQKARESVYYREDANTSVDHLMDEKKLAPIHNQILEVKRKVFALEFSRMNHDDDGKFAISHEFVMDGTLDRVTEQIKGQIGYNASIELESELDKICNIFTCSKYMN